MKVSATAFLMLVGACVAQQRTTPAFSIPSTRYRVGDYVVYRYDGIYSVQPVLFREEICAQEGNRLRIDIQVIRDQEQRRWIQVVTDTPENQRNNVIDALYEWQGDRLVRLANEGSRDLLRLYEWTILTPDGQATDVHNNPCVREIGGTRFACTCTSGRNTWRGKVIRFEVSRCPDFLWTNGPVRFWEEATGLSILNVNIVEFGHRPEAPSQPFDPT
jgi:hypothetical protein